MKKVKILMFALLAALYSCDDAIDIIQPSEREADDVYTSVEDMQLGLNAIYNSVPGENMILFTSIFTDEVAIGVSNGGQGLGGELAFLLNPLSGDASGIWLSNYYMINLANRLIEASEQVEVEAGSEEEAQKLSILAQARSLRAYGHLNLMTYFSPDMADDSSLGVILMDFVPENDAEIPRSTTGEIFTFINEDLDFAEANLPEPTPANFSNFFVSKYFVTAFRARMAAYREQYALAKDYVDDLDVTFNLTPKAQYPGIWTDADIALASNEVIFKLNRTVTGQTGNFAQAWSSVNSTVTGSPFFEVNRALFNLVNFPGDVRRTVIVDQSAVTQGKILSNAQLATVSDDEYKANDILPVGKYAGSEGQNLLNDIKVFRFSEMVLIRAEYFASINDFDGVATQVNLVRAARFGNATGNIATPANNQAAWYAIMQERRAELAFEGHRYIDIKRLGTSDKANAGVERFYRDCAFNNFCTLPADDYRFTMPIPLSEKVANPAIQQNPDYNN